MRTVNLLKALCSIISVALFLTICGCGGNELMIKNPEQTSQVLEGVENDGFVDSINLNLELAEPTSGKAMTITASSFSRPYVQVRSVMDGGLDWGSKIVIKVEIFNGELLISNHYNYLRLFRNGNTGFSISNMSGVFPINTLLRAEIKVAILSADTSVVNKNEWSTKNWDNSVRFEGSVQDTITTSDSTLNSIVLNEKLDGLVSYLNDSVSRASLTDITVNGAPLIYSVNINNDYKETKIATLTIVVRDPNVTSTTNVSGFYFYASISSDADRNNPFIKQDFTNTASNAILTNNDIQGTITLDFTLVDTSAISSYYITTKAKDANGAIYDFSFTL